MTKEEAAIIIHKLKQDVLTGAVRKYEPFEGEVLLSAEFCDAINMAIDALKQEPCEDAVSRKAVYEILNDAYFLKLDDGAALQESVRQLPPVNPQEPILDKTRAEIEQAADKQLQIAIGVTDLNERYTHIQMESAYRHSLNIIDKYRKEE